VRVRYLAAMRDDETEHRVVTRPTVPGHYSVEARPAGSGGDSHRKAQTSGLPCAAILKSSPRGWYCVKQTNILGIRRGYRPRGLSTFCWQAVMKLIRWINFPLSDHAFSRRGRRMLSPVWRSNNKLDIELMPIYSTWSSLAYPLQAPQISGPYSFGPLCYC